jgi:T5SS/PEP-CTERM-associated repeat protein
MFKLRKSHAAIVFAIVIPYMLTATASVFAQDATWINAAGGNFGTNSNWDTGSKPGFDDEATFSLSQVYDVFLNNPEEIIAGLNVTDGDVRLQGGNILTVKTGSGANSNIDGGILRVEGNGTFLNSEQMSLLNSGEINVTNSAMLTVGDDPSTFTNSNGQISVSSFTSAGGTLSANSGSKVRTGGYIFSGLSAGSDGSIDVNGAGSELSAGGDAFFGYRGASSLVAGDGAVVSNDNGYLGSFATSNSSATISSGARWDNSGRLEIGRFGEGILNISGGGAVTADEVFLGSTTIGTGRMSLSSDGSLTANRNLHIGTSNSTSGEVFASVFDGKIQVGDSGAGIARGIVVSDFGSDGNLFIRRGLLQASSEDMLVAYDSGSQGSVQVTGSESSLRVGKSYIGYEGFGVLDVYDSGDVEVDDTLAVGVLAGSQGTVLVRNLGRLAVGDSFTLGVDEFDRAPGAGTLEITNGGTVIVGSTSASVTSEGIHLLSNGIIDAQNGSLIETTESFVDSNAALAIKNSQLGNSGSAQIFGILNIQEFGIAGFGGDLTVGRTFGSSSNASVSVDQSQLIVEGKTELRRGDMLFQGSSEANLRDFEIGDDDSSAVASALFVRSEMNVVGDLDVGTGAGFGSLTLAQGDIVGKLAMVSGRTTIGENGSINIEQNTFDFGTTDWGSYSRIVPGGAGTSMQGTLTGHVESDGFVNVSDLNSFNKARLNTSGVTLENLGVIYGDGATDVEFSTSADSEIRTRAGEWARFGASEIQNFGEINVLGGTTEFENTLTNKLDGEINNFGGTFIADNLINDVGAFISGRGEFLSHGISNNGVMAFSGGFADIHGDVQNLGDGVVVTAGDGVTTFYDDVLHNGQEVHTAAGADTVYFGEFTGSGAHTGTGDVFMEGDFRPGNSPDVLTFEGNLNFGTSAATFVELGGTGLGEFDRLEVAGDMTLNGSLEVELLSGFDLVAGDFFEIADIGGSAFGEFTGLAEGELVGNFGGTDLFISYQWGDGNNVALFTAVPEPGSMAVVAFAMGMLMLKRRR